MTYKELIKAIKEAKIVMALVHVTDGSSSTFRITKQVALGEMKLFKDCGDIEFKAGFIDGTGILLIGWGN